MSDLDVQNINSKTGNSAISIADDGATTVSTFTSTGIDDNATSTAITIDSSGNVGIGTSSPQTTLSISDNSPSVHIVDADAASINETSAAFEFYRSNATTSAGGLYKVSGAQHLKIATQSGGGFITLNTASDSEAMRIDSSGNVGIGTNDPGVALSIAGGSGSDILAVGDEGTGNEFVIGNWNNSSDSDIDGLIGGSTFGTIMRGAPNGHVVLALRENDANDGFYVVSGGGNYQTDTTYDTVAMALNAAGNLTTSGNITAYSDERLKSDVETLDGSKVYEMRGVSFTKDGEASSGVIAQELQKVAPELVNESGEYLSVAYGNIVGYLIEAVKDLKAEIEELKNGASN